MVDQRRLNSSFDESIDSLVERARAEFKNVQTQKQAAALTVKSLEGQRDKLSQEIIELEKKYSEIIKISESQAEGIAQTAQEKLNTAVTKESEVNNKLATLDQKIKDLDDLIKSNQGYQRNLDQLTEDATRKSAKLNELVVLISETLKNS